jgi:hypothetical protein
MLKPVEPAASPLREKAMLALVGFLFTGVIGTMATTWIQQRGWYWQNRVAKIDKDTQNVLAAYQNASDIVNRRWYAIFRMTRAIDRGAPEDEWKAAREEYAAAEKDWAIRYTSVARDVAFYVDTPFGIDSKEMMKQVWPLACTTYSVGTGGFQIETMPARVILEIVNHCAGLVKDEIDGMADPTGATPPKLDAAARKARAGAAFAKLDAIYRTNETLRCVMFERASSIRQTLDADSYWGSFFGVTPQTYSLPKQGARCLQ